MWGPTSDGAITLSRGPNHRLCSKTPSSFHSHVKS
jgi:hypothetical protein